MLYLKPAFTNFLTDRKQRVRFEGKSALKQSDQQHEIHPPKDVHLMTLFRQTVIDFSQDYVKLLKTVHTTADFSGSPPTLTRDR